MTRARWLALIFLLFILLVILAADLNAIPPFVRALYNFPNGDLVGHFVLYGLLAGLLAHAFPRRWGRLPAVSLALLTFAALEEFSQSFVAVRTASWADFACSALGILLGTWLALRRRATA
jgi:VanZ family protein